MTRPNNTETIYGYDANGRLNDIHHKRTSTQATVLRYAYTLDAAGRRTGVVVTSETGVRAEKYVYDDFNRLTEVTYSDDNGTIDASDRVVRYGYDKNDRRLTQTTFANGISAGATETLTYGYGFENRLLTVTDQNGVVQERYAYDQQGNQVQKITPSKSIQYAYNSRNLLTAVDDGLSYIQYVYDGAGRRVAEVIDGATNRLINDPSKSIFQVLEERQQNGSIVADYSYGLERVGGTISGQTSRLFYLSDSLGSVGALANRDGATVDTYRYDVFGGLRSGTRSTSNPFLFTGERFSEKTGSIYLRNREYDVRAGGFLQKDPELFADSVNNYSYVAANPILYTDPLGLSSIGDSLRKFVEENYPNKDRYRDLSGSSVGPNGEKYDDKNGFIDMRHYGVARDVALALTGGTVAVGVGVGVAVGSVPIAVAAPVVAVLGVNVVAGGLWEAGQYDGKYSASSFRNQDLRSNFLGSLEGATLGLLKFPNKTLNQILFPTPEFTDFGNKNFSWPTYASVGTPGGVLLDKAATLIDANLDDIAGASYDPATGQLVFLGSQNPGTLANVNLDLFATAIQSVFGSAVPPYVTLDPPAKLIQSSFNLGNGDGVILNGKTASVPIKYTPYTPTEIDDMSLSFKINGQQQTVRLNGWVMNGQGGLNASAGGRPGQGLTLFGGVSNGQGQATLASSVSGITYTMPAFGTDVMKPQFNAGNINLNAGNSINIGNFGGGGYTFLLSPQTQDSTWTFSITNNSGSTQTISDLQLVPDRQHRKFGGRVDNTRLGWIIEEADRVMKALGIGKDHLTGATYNSSTPDLPPGYQNLLERYRDAGISGNFNNRFWFTPNEQTLKRFIDPSSGEATVVFDRATVKLNTEALVLGQPEDIVARNWAEYFNANYDAFAAKTFPVYDPDDPTHTKIINVKIFDELRNAMKAVSLARFFKDNNIPLDTWWLNSYQAPVKYTPLTIPTLTNSLQNGAITLTMHGGVSIKTPNAYIPDVVAKSIADAVKNQRPAGSGDLAGQSWNVTSGTSYGGLKAVATTLDDRKQDANITLAATDLTFPSAGGRQLAFNRFYNSGYLIDDNLGRGWRSVQYDLQFQLPSYVDDAGLMRDSTGASLSVFGADSDTRLRSGELRIYDHGTGTLLDFNSSLSARYELDAQQNPIFLISGLSANKVPTFTPGTYRDGSSLTQDPSSFNYTLTRSDGSKLVFDFNGKLLQDIDSRGYTLSYSYTTSGKLSQIVDGTNQAIRLTYGADGRIDTVIAPEPTGNAQRKVQYVYDTQGRLIRVDIQALQGDGTYLTTRDTKYDYNTDNQLTGITGPDGVKTLTAAIDLMGRQDIRQDAIGNMADLNFTLDSTTGDRTTQTIDMGTSGLNSATAHGLAAIKYFAPGSTSVQQFDPTARTTKTVDALGNEIKFGYSGDLQAPTSITLPTPNRPAISVQRNSLSLPTVINDPANVGATPIQITYTAANKLDTTTDSKGRVTKYTYTDWHDVSTVTIDFGTPLSATTTYNYNSNKLLASIVDPLGQTVQSYDYDAFGNITKLTDADGVVTTVTYDTLGRLKRVFDPRLTGTIKFTEYFYNDNDQVTRIATPTGDITNIYDPITKRLVSTTDLTGTTTQFDYNTAGQLISETQVSSSGNAVTQYEYDRRGELVALTAPEGHRTAFRSDVLGRSTDVIEDNNIAPIASVRAIPGISTNTLDVFVKASEPIVVASLKYWQEGQSSSSAITRDMRVTDQTDLVFNLTNIDQSKNYRYELTLTDRVGRDQTLPQAILPVDAILNIANSEHEFSGVQGQNNWYYGYYLKPFTSADYQPMTQFVDNVWKVNNGTFWTLISDYGGHPNGVIGGITPVDQWAVRRWASEVDGEIRIYGILAKGDTQGGNGVIGRIFVDGVQVWSQSIAGTDGTGVNYQITTKVKLNSIVDFAIDPKDSYDGADTTIFKAKIDALNQTPTNLILSNSNIAENQAVGTLIGNLNTTDPDSGNTFTYSLVTGIGSTDNALFTVTGNQLKTNSVFDYETKNSYSIRVKATDQGGLSYEKQLTIGINTANSLTEFSGIQGQNNWYYGYYDGPFTNSDFQQMSQFSDIWTVQNGTYYTLLRPDGGHPNGGSVQQWAVRRWVSEIDGEVQIYGNLAKLGLGGNGVIGRIFIDGVEVWSQSIAGTDGTGVNYQIRAKVKLNSVVDFAIDPKDANDENDTTAFTAQIDALNQTPTNLTLSNSNVAENQTIGTLIGNLNTTDPDSGNTFTYSLVTGIGSTDNALFTITGNQLKTNSVLDYETKNSYSIRVKTTDQGGLFYEKALTINIGDLPEYTTIESVGNTTLLKDPTNKYFAQVGTAAPIAIKNGGQQIYKDIYSSDWQTLAVETVNGENQVLWKNVTGNYLHIWKTDSNWNWVSSEGQWDLNSNDAFNQENTFGVDANGDGSVGSPYTAIESFGNTQFVKDVANKYFAQVGTADPIAIKKGGQQIYQSIFGTDWQTLALENVNGEKQVL